MHSPLNTPLHPRVGQDKRRYDIEDLVASSPDGVKDTLCKEAGEGSLAVRAQSVGDGTTAGLAAALVWVTPVTNVIPVQKDRLVGIFLCILDMMAIWMRRKSTVFGKRGWTSGWMDHVRSFVARAIRRGTAGHGNV